jgi:hypothetical protein
MQKKNRHNCSLNGAEVTPFQSAFFGELASVEASNKKEFIEQASRRGIPREAAAVFWRTRLRTSEPPSREEVAAEIDADNRSQI